ncbi:centromere/kinetochore protein zw10-like [Condylostylus longicornis]|uniref:centromere/kinetochore protein zw10-like n=1 Tax=Condylostylus longicornis TaxID=2530218 RepID=UPI00244DF3EE|nr:centromere/kinetochore protein zw10-like [Condylostylus longicornis]
MTSIRETITNVCSDNADVKKNLAKISAEIKRYQEKTKIYIERNYEQFLPNLTTNELLLNEGEKLVREVDDLLQKIENEDKQHLASANEEIQQYQDELKEISLGLKTTYKILKIDELFQCLEEEKSRQEFLIVKDIVGKLKNLIMDPKDKIFPRLLCYKNIKIKYHFEYEMLLHNLKEYFEQLVELKEKSFENTKSITLKISKDENKLNDVAVALFSAKYNASKMCEFLFKNVFHPIITKTVSLDFNDDCSEEYVELLLSYNITEPNTDLPLRVNYKTVFENITAVLTCLSYINVQISDTVSVMNVFAEHLKVKVLDILINDCLMYAIPKSVDEMRESTLQEDVIKFSKVLSDMYLINETNDKELIKFTESVGTLFRKRFTTKILHDTVDILRKDLHDMILVAEKNTPSELERDPFLFPKCMVSKSSLELISVMKNVIEEAFASKEEKSERLSVISSIIEQYMIEVPRYHEKMLNMIPQQTALFYNNCMYLAHWLTKTCEKDIQGFQILAQSLQSLGNEYFSNQVKSQHSQLHDILKDFDLTDAVSDIGIGPQKITRQCLRQLELLKNVWQKILPETFYNKQVSGLLNDFFNEIIRNIMKIEDISTSLSHELVEIIGIIEDRAPRVFEDKKEVFQVKSWMKLMQLKMILGASLLDITEQWSEGKGPLTLNFKAEEIKHLIRALFQNTTRRANALALII